MTKLFLSLALCGLTASTAYVLLKLLLFMGRGVSQRWRYHAGTAVALLFLLPLHKLWCLLPAAPAAKPGKVLVVLSASPAPDLGNLLQAGTALWLAVAGCLLLWNLCCLLRFRRQVRRAEPLLNGLLPVLAQEEAQRLGIRGQVRLYLAPEVPSPMLVGYFRPVLLLPTEKLSPEDARLVLAHELVHYRRGDLWKTLLTQVLCLLHWYNPAAHLLKRDLLYWMETACDEAVVQPLDFAQRKQYGYLLIDGVCPSSLLAKGVPFAPSRKALERRITTMLHSEHKAHSALGGVLAMALAAGCLVTTAFAADLNKDTTPAAAEKASMVSVGIAQASTESIPINSEPGEDITYTVVASDEAIDGQDVLYLKDFESLGNGDYLATTTVDGEEVTISVHIETEE